MFDRGSDTCFMCKKKATKIAIRKVTSEEVLFFQKQKIHSGVNAGDDEKVGFCDYHDPIDGPMPEAGWRRG